MTYNISEVKRHFVISGTSLYPFRFKRSLYNVIRWKRLRDPIDDFVITGVSLYPTWL